MVNDSGANEVAFRVAWNLDASSIEENLAVLSTILNKTLNLGQMLGVLKWGNIRVVPSSSDSQGLGFLNDLRDPLSRVTDHDYD